MRVRIKLDTEKCCNCEREDHTLEAVRCSTACFCDAIVAKVVSAAKVTKPSASYFNRPRSKRRDGSVVRIRRKLQSYLHQCCWYFAVIDRTPFHVKMGHVGHRIRQDIVDNRKGMMTPLTLLAAILLEGSADQRCMQSGCHSLTHQD